MQKKLTGLLMALPALLLAFIFLMMPMLNNFFMSFQRYDMLVSRGWAGLDNYFQVLLNPGLLPQMVFQTLTLQFFAGLTAAAIGGLAAFALSRLANSTLRWALAAVLASVSFFPVGGVSVLRISGGFAYSLYASPVLAVFLHLLIAIVRGIGPALLLGLAGALFSERRGGNAFGGAAAGTGVWFLFYLALAVQNSFSLPYQLGGNIGNWNGTPLLLAYTIGFSRFEFSLAAAISVITYCIALAFLVPAAIVLRYLLFRNPGAAAVSPSPAAKSVSLPLLAAGFVLLAAGAVSMTFFGRDSVLPTGISYLFLYLFGALLCGGLTILLAAPLNSSSAPVRAIAAIVYLFLAAAPMSSVGNYELFSDMRLINTSASVVLSSLFCMPAVLVMGLYLNRSRGHGLPLGNYLSASIRPAVCVAAFHFLMLWGDNLASERLYISVPGQFSPNLALTQTAANPEPGLSPFAFLLAAILVSAGVLLLAAACLRERVPAEPLTVAPSETASVE